MRLLQVIVAVGLILTLAVAGVGWWGWQTLHQPFGNWPGETREVLIAQGTSATAILLQLERAGVLRDATLARFFLVWKLKDPALKAGEYAFDTPLSTPEVLDILMRGAVVTHSVTLIEGLDVEESARVLAEAGFGSEQTFLREMKNPERIADLDPQATDLEGYLFPDTYAFARNTSETAIVDTLVETFRLRISGGFLPLEKLRQVVTLASIVEKEAQLADERPVIAGVYANRLQQGMALGADPTVIFALKLEGRWDGNIRKPDLKMDSPYNTYRRVGLPPGPICSPGLASLTAAAAPAETPYLYFVGRNDGSHVFSRNLAEHNRAVEIHQRQYWRNRWAEERRAKEAEKAQN